MATAIGLEGSPMCAICYGHYINPRKLPGCYHSFCEKCLLTYITNLKLHEEDLLEFKCPNCRKEIPLPELEGLQN